MWFSCSEQKLINQWESQKRKKLLVMETKSIKLEVSVLIKNIFLVVGEWPKFSFNGMLEEQKNLKLKSISVQVGTKGGEEMSTLDINYFAIRFSFNRLHKQIKLTIDWKISIIYCFNRTYLFHLTFIHSIISLMCVLFMLAKETFFCLNWCNCKYILHIFLPANCEYFIRYNCIIKFKSKWNAPYQIMHT